MRIYFRPGMGDGFAQIDQPIAGLKNEKPGHGENTLKS